MKQFFIILFSLTLFSGCDVLEKMLEIKNNTHAQVSEIENTISKIQENISTKKGQIDEKIEQIQELKTSLDALLGNDTLSIEDKKVLEQLKEETEILEQAVVDMKDQSTNRINDTSEFSIE